MIRLGLTAVDVRWCNQILYPSEVTSTGHLTYSGVVSREEIERFRHSPAYYIPKLNKTK